MENSNLTPKQEAFARTYVETGNASQAYRDAYSVAEETKPETVWVEACRLLAKPAVGKLVMELQEAARKRLQVTIESLTSKLEEARNLAMKDEKGASAAVSAVMGMAKLHGLLIDKKEVAGKDGGTVRHEVEFVSPSDRFALAKATAHILNKGMASPPSTEQPQVEFTSKKAGE